MKPWVQLFLDSGTKIQHQQFLKNYQNIQIIADGLSWSISLSDLGNSWSRNSPRRMFQTSYCINDIDLIRITMTEYRMTERQRDRKNSLERVKDENSRMIGRNK